MARTIITPQEFRFDPQKEFENLNPTSGLELKLMPWILFKGYDQFDRMCYNSRSEPYPNGHFKNGTLRYSPGKLIIPISSRLLAFETTEFNNGMPPRRIISLGQVVICPLEELTDDELLDDGFESRKDMLWQMTEMEGRYYPDLTPQSTISYLGFAGVSPFSGVSAPEIITVHILKTGGKEYWDQLVAKDRTGWTYGFRRC
jgi:hypothetical protein